VLPLLVCIAFDVVLITLWFSENTPKPFRVFYDDEKHVSACTFKTFTLFYIPV
jgi:hypothetical protein